MTPLGEPEMLHAHSLIFILIVGCVAGLLASIVIPTGLDLIGAIVVGVIGAAIGTYLFPAFGSQISTNPTVAAIITATAGAIILLVILRLVRR
jgi:uncharacterized membrane protein YeaQ/YmgE (transglycosylase-associated protein family)